MPSRRLLGARLFSIFTAALLGYLWGWMWAWSLADPNLDLWALGPGWGR